MQPKYIDQDNDARLNSGIVFYKGEPHVLSLVSKVKATLVNLKDYGVTNENAVVTTMSDKNLDVSSPALGYINIDGSTAYVRRIPARKYKQSLSAASLSARYPDGSQLDTHSIASLLYSVKGYEMLMGIYPSYDEALARVIRNKTPNCACAFSRECAVVKRANTVIEIHIKGEKVGTYDSTTNTVKVVENPFSWVTERILLKHNVKIG